MTLHQVPELTFGFAFNQARASSDLIADATSPFSGDASLYFLSEDWTHGFAIQSDCTLVYVFSTERGHGDEIVTRALAEGATKLDCFDGYLPTLYGRHGFVETDRAANWTPGGPDVVWMALPAGSELHR